MARKAPTKRRKTKKRGPLLTVTAVRRVGLGVGWLATFAALAYGLNAIEPYALSAYGEPSTYPTRIEWTNLPAWLADERYAEVLTEIEDRIGLAADADPHYEGLCEWVHSRAASSPWIADVYRVTKRADNVVRVTAEFRKPLTYALRGNNAYLLDHAGYQLWPAIARERVDPRWLPIDGLHHAPPGQGNLWPGIDREGGLALVSLLNRAGVDGRLPHRNVLKAVDVSGYADSTTGVLRIKTISPDVNIIWGRAPGKEFETEALAAEKLDRLREQFGSGGELPPAGVYDLRPKGEIWFQPATP